jgi:hypothetical protein
MEISTNIVINASSEKVWNVLADFNSYPKWNPFIRSIIGKAGLGNSLTVYIEPPGAKGMVFKPRITVLVQNKELRWLGHLLFRGLFDGEHIFSLNDNGDETVTFTQSEKFTGVLVPFFKKTLKVNTLNGFKEMNQKLKNHVEQL